MRRSKGKLLGILLAASILATTAYPMQGTAAEETDRETEQAVQTSEENVISGETLENTGSDDPLQTNEMDGTSIMPFSYDINQPVIESFELAENGQTVSRDDTLHFKMSAYDADRDISYIKVEFRRRNSPTFSVEFQKSGDMETLYTGTFDCSSLIGYEGDYYVSKIWLEDETNNYVEYPVMEDGKYLYTFTFQNTRTIKVSDYQIQKNSSDPDGKLRVGDTVTLTAHVECEGMNFGSAQLYLRAVNSGHTDYIGMSYNAQTQTLTGTYKITDRTYPEEWSINYLNIRAANSEYRFLSESGRAR